MNTGEIIMYQNPEGDIKIDVRLEEETGWLTQAQICELFQKSKATISEHIKHVFSEGEVVESSVVRKFRTAAADEKNYEQTLVWKSKNHQILINLKKVCRFCIFTAINRHW